MLFIKRSNNGSHAGDIAYPGGRVDGDENDFEACVREVNEELGFNSSDIGKLSYLGKFPENFYAYYRKK